jgi:hypothetical protein
MWFSGSVVQRIKGSGDDRIRIRIRERRGGPFCLVGICGSVVQWFSGSEDQRFRG